MVYVVIYYSDGEDSFEVQCVCDTKEKAKQFIEIKREHACDVWEVMAVPFIREIQV
jgi:hypothetical protein